MNEDEYCKQLDREFMESQAKEIQGKPWNYGYVYLIDFGDSKTFKIGITKHDPVVRLGAIRSGAKGLYPTPLDAKLVLTTQTSTNTYYIEQLLHMHFAQDEKHASGEWFYLNEVDLADVATVFRTFGAMEYHDRWYEIFSKLSDTEIFVRLGLNNELCYRELNIEEFIENMQELAAYNG